MNTVLQQAFELNRTGVSLLAQGHNYRAFTFFACSLGTFRIKDEILSSIFHQNSFHISIFQSIIKFSAKALSYPNLHYSLHADKYAKASVESSPNTLQREVIINEGFLFGHFLDINLKNVQYAIAVTLFNMAISIHLIQPKGLLKESDALKSVQLYDMVLDLIDFSSHNISEECSCDCECCICFDEAHLLLATLYNKAQILHNFGEFQEMKKVLAKSQYALSFAKSVAFDGYEDELVDSFALKFHFFLYPHSAHAA